MNSLVLSELSEQDESADNAEHIHDNIELPDITHITGFIDRFEESLKKASIQARNHYLKYHSKDEFLEYMVQDEVYFADLEKIENHYLESLSQADGPRSSLA